MKKQSLRYLIRIMLPNSINAAAIGISMPLLPLLFELKYHVDPSIIGYLYTFAYVVTALGSYISGKYINGMFDSLKIASIAHILQGALFIIIAFTPLFFLAGVIYIFRMGIAGVGSPMRGAINVRGIDREDYGTSTAIQGISGRASQLTSGASGYLMDLNFAFPLLIGGSLQALGGVLYYTLIKSWNPGKHDQPGRRRHDMDKIDKRVWYLGFTRLIRASGRVSTFIFLPLIFVFIYRISFLVTGLVLGIAILIMSVVQYYSGILTDRIGRRIFLILIPLPAGLLYIAMYFTVLYRMPALLLILLFYFTILINALQYPAIQASIADVTSLGQRLSGYTVIRVLANAGAAIGPILGAILSVYGFQYIFLLAGISTFIEIIILYFNVRETYFPSKSQYLTKLDIKLAYKDRFFIIFTVIGIIMAFVLRQSGASLTLYAFDFERLPILYLAYIYSLNGILAVTLQYPVFKIMNKSSNPVFLGP